MLNRLVVSCTLIVIFRSIAFCIIILRIIFIGTAIIARLRNVRTAVWRRRQHGAGAAILSCLCRRLRYQTERGNIGSFSGVFCGGGINHRHRVFRYPEGW